MRPKLKFFVRESRFFPFPHHVSKIKIKKIKKEGPRKGPNPCRGIHVNGI